MGTLWTPGGERPVPPDPATRDAAAAAAGDEHRAPGVAPGEQPTEEQVREHMRALRDELARTPAATVIANHGYGLFELAALHLSLDPPQIGEAQVAIDALGALVEGLTGRLGEHEANLKEGLAQLRLAFVQVRASNLGAT